MPRFRKGKREPCSLADLASRVLVLLGKFVRALPGTMCGTTENTFRAATLNSPTDSLHPAVFARHLAPL